MEDKITLGKFIQTKRKENGLSQKELAMKLYVTESAVSKWERGVSYPDITMISGICEALKISEHELCTASVDHKQHEIERKAEQYERFIRNYNLILFLCYAAAIIPCFFVFVIKEHTPSKFFILLTSLMLTASLLNVPTLVQKQKELITLGSFWASLNLLLLSGCIYSSGDWFIMAFLSILMGFTIVFLPFIVRSEPLVFYVGNNKALICMVADTIFILLEIAYGTLKYGTFYDFKSGMLSALWCFLLLWAIFAIVRYLKINALFKTSACLIVIAFWIFISNPVMNLLIEGTFILFNEVNNYYGIIPVSLVLVIAAAAFVIGGAVLKFLKKPIDKL